MTNKEYYKDEILDIACRGYTVCVDKRFNRPCACYNTPCEYCLFQQDGECRDEQLKEWANAEYVELCEFEKDELVEVSDNGEIWFLAYFSHLDTSNKIYKYRTFPNCEKDHESRTTNSWRMCKKYGTLGGLVKGETD